MTAPAPRSSSSIRPPPHHQSIAEVAAALGSDEAKGLSWAEARQRLHQFGRNELAAESPLPTWRRFLHQFRDTLVLLLLVATIISTLLWVLERETALPYEALAILVVVILNAILGFVQETRARAAVAALRDLAADEAAVIRGGKQANVPAVELVPGDLIALEEGDTVPADARLVSVSSLQIAEAALTGESHPVTKSTDPLIAEEEAGLGDRTNMVFSGTAITYGRGRALVTATGMQTEMGKVAELLHETETEPTPLQRELDRTGRRLGLVVLVIAVVMVATILLLEDVSGASGILDVLIFGVALAVAAVPEGLPAVVTAVLAIGVQRMARRKAIVRHLSAVETLGSASVIASDKTGTLTRNEMTVRRIVTASGETTFDGTSQENAATPEPGTPLGAELRRALIAAERASNAIVQQGAGQWRIQGDPTEGALIVAARQVGMTEEELASRFTRLGELPFSSERKRMSTLHSDAKRSDRLLLFTKGAADVLLARCSHELVGDEARPLTDDRRQQILADTEAMAADALRTLGIATRVLPRPRFTMDRLQPELESELTFLGLVGMIDPPRPEAREAVDKARGAGIRPLMITGDHPVTASVIARELGIATNDRVITGAQLERMDDHELEQALRKVAVFARVDPAHKLRIVDAMQRGGEVVAMTGDGVNDAPALKSADIGVAMGITGTDVSKEAADMVLADDNFATIVAAVEEGRSIFDNIRKFLRYLLSSNIGEVMTMFFGVLFADLIGLSAQGDGVALPLVATQILWINLVTDGAPALALGVDPASPGLMERAPRPAAEPVITRQMWHGVFLVGMVMAVGTLAVIDLSLPGGLLPGDGDLPYAQTMAFTTLVFFQIFNVFNARSDVRSALPELFRNRWLTGALALSILLQIAVIYLPVLQLPFGTVPLLPGDWLLAAGVASSVLWVREAVKLMRRVSGRVGRSL